MLRRDAPIARNPSVVYRDLAEGGVLLHLDSGQYHGVNGTGLVVWNLLDRAKTLDELVAAVGTEVAHAPAQLEEDVCAFVEALQMRDLVVVEPS
ncbi:MAG: PqqD family protein [Gaiellaceae bacterium]